jgi:hypothetical protein
MYCEDYAGYFTVILPFLAFYFCSAYFIYLVSCRVPWLVSLGNLAMKILCRGSPLAGSFKFVKVSHTDSEEPMLSKQRL